MSADGPGHPEWDPEDYAWDGVNLTAARKPRQGASHANSTAYSEYLHQDVPMLMSRPPVGALTKAQKLVCQVQGCNRSLQNSKLYYQRFKLCEDHLKSPAISIDGVLQRLCQQCGRFHELSAFEGKKRTCRAQLDRIRKNKERKRQAGGSSDSPERDVDGDGEDTRGADTRGHRRGGGGRAERSVVGGGGGGGSIGAAGGPAVAADGAGGGGGGGGGGPSCTSGLSGTTSNGSANAGHHGTSATAAASGGGVNAGGGLAAATTSGGIADGGMHLQLDAGDLHSRGLGHRRGAMEEWRRRGAAEGAVGEAVGHESAVAASSAATAAAYLQLPEGPVVSLPVYEGMMLYGGGGGGGIGGPEHCAMTGLFQAGSVDAGGGGGGGGSSTSCGPAATGGCDDATGGQMAAGGGAAVVPRLSGSPVDGQLGPQGARGAAGHLQYTGLSLALGLQNVAACGPLGVGATSAKQQQQQQLLLLQARSSLPPRPPFSSLALAAAAAGGPKAAAKALRHQEGAFESTLGHQALGASVAVQQRSIAAAGLVSAGSGGAGGTAGGMVGAPGGEPWGLTAAPPGCGVGGLTQAGRPGGGMQPLWADYPGLSGLGGAGTRSASTVTAVAAAQQQQQQRFGGGSGWGAGAAAAPPPPPPQQQQQATHVATLATAGSRTLPVLTDVARGPAPAEELGGDGHRGGGGAVAAAAVAATAALQLPDSELQTMLAELDQHALNEPGGNNRSLLQSGAGLGGSLRSTLSTAMNLAAAGGELLRFGGGGSSRVASGDGDGRGGAGSGSDPMDVGGGGGGVLPLEAWGASVAGSGGPFHQDSSRPVSASPVSGQDGPTAAVVGMHGGMMAAGGGTATQFGGALHPTHNTPQRQVLDLAAVHEGGSIGKGGVSGASGDLALREMFDTLARQSVLQYGEPLGDTPGRSTGVHGGGVHQTIVVSEEGLQQPQQHHHQQQHFQQQQVQVSLHTQQQQQQQQAHRFQQQQQQQQHQPTRGQGGLIADAQAGLNSSLVHQQQHADQSPIRHQHQHQQQQQQAAASLQAHQHSLAGHGHPGSGTWGDHGGGGAGGGGGVAAGGGGGAGGLTSNAASSMLQTLPLDGGADGGLPYIPRDTLTRVTIKLLNCLPDDLPRHLRANLQQWVSGGTSAEVLQACMRPGCLELVVDVVHTNSLDFTSLSLANKSADLVCQKIRRVVTERLAADNEIVLEVGGLVLLAPPSGYREHPVIKSWGAAALTFAERDGTIKADQVASKAPPAAPAMTTMASGAPAAAAAAAAGGDAPDGCEGSAAAAKPCEPLKPCVMACSLAAARSAPVIAFNLFGEHLDAEDVTICARMGGQITRLQAAKLPLRPQPTQSPPHHQPTHQSSRAGDCRKSDSEPGPASEYAGGMHSLTPAEAVAAAAAAPPPPPPQPTSLSRVSVQVQPARQAGLLVLEPRRGRLLGGWWPVVVVPDPLVAGELNFLAAQSAEALAAGVSEESSGFGFGSFVEPWLRDFLVDLGQVLDWVGWQGHNEGAADGADPDGGPLEVTGSWETWGSDTSESVTLGGSTNGVGRGMASGGGSVGAGGGGDSTGGMPSGLQGPSGAPGGGRLLSIATAAAAVAAASMVALRRPGLHPPASIDSHSAATPDGSWAGGPGSRVTDASSRCSWTTHNTSSAAWRSGEVDGDGSSADTRALATLRNAEMSLAMRLSYKCCRLLAFCVVRGLVHTSAMLWSVLQLQGVGLKAILEHAMYDGEGLMLCAVRSRSCAMVMSILSRLQGGAELKELCVKGPSGLTALHLAAALPNCQEIAHLLLQHVSGVPQLWFAMRGHPDICRQTPAQLAERYGNLRLNVLAQQVLRHGNPGAMRPPPPPGFPPSEEQSPVVAEAEAEAAAAVLVQGQGLSPGRGRALEGSLGMVGAAEATGSEREVCAPAAAAVAAVTAAKELLLAPTAPLPPSDVPAHTQLLAAAPVSNLQQQEQEQQVPSAPVSHTLEEEQLVDPLPPQPPAEAAPIDGRGGPATVGIAHSGAGPHLAAAAVATAAASAAVPPAAKLPSSAAEGSCPPCHAAGVAVGDVAAETAGRSSPAAREAAAGGLGSGLGAKLAPSNISPPPLVLPAAAAAAAAGDSAPSPTTSIPSTPTAAPPSVSHNEYASPGKRSVLAASPPSIPVSMATSTTTNGQAAEAETLLQTASTPSSPPALDELSGSRSSSVAVSGAERAVRGGSTGALPAQRGAERAEGAETVSVVARMGSAPAGRSAAPRGAVGDGPGRSAEGDGAGGSSDGNGTGRSGGGAAATGSSRSSFKRLLKQLVPKKDWFKP